MVNKKKGFASIALLVVLLIVIAGTYFAVTHIPKTTEKGTVPPPATAVNWKTYSNTQYSFEFQYPNDRIFKEVKGTDGSGVNYFDVKIDTEQNMEFTCNDCDGPATFLKVSIYKPKTDPVASCFLPPQGEISKASVGGMEGDKCVADGLNGPNLLLYLTKDGIIYYQIQADNYSGEQKALIDQIITTFKFTK